MTAARPAHGDPRTRATLIGALAVLMWALLAPMTAAAHDIPPLQLLATTFGIAFVSGILWLLISGGTTAVRKLRQPWTYLAFAVIALFGYHALYFAALSLAPPAQASLVAYLWPLLIVWFAALGDRSERIRAPQIVGALLGLTGTAVLILSRDSAGLESRHVLLGLLAALACAVIWSGYSVLNRRFQHIPSEAMVGVCGLVAVCGWLAHWLLDPQTVAARAPQWLAMIGLGVGPVGLAFLAWDHGTKHGRLALLGSVSYGAPVLSTLLLVCLGDAPARWSLLVACVLVTAGAWLASSTRPAAAVATRTEANAERARPSGKA